MNKGGVGPQRQWADQASPRRWLGGCEASWPAVKGGLALQKVLTGLHGRFRHKMKLVESDQESIVGKSRSQNFEFSQILKQGSEMVRLDTFKSCSAFIHDFLFHMLSFLVWFIFPQLMTLHSIAVLNLKFYFTPSVCVCVCVWSRFSSVWCFEALWTVACQASLSMGLPKQVYWNRLPFSSSGDLPDPGIEPVSLVSPALASAFFTTRATWEALYAK